MKFHKYLEDEGKYFNTLKELSEMLGANTLSYIRIEYCDKIDLFKIYTDYYKYDIKGYISNLTPSLIEEIINYNSNIINYEWLFDELVTKRKFSYMTSSSMTWFFPEVFAINDVITPKENVIAFGKIDNVEIKEYRFGFDSEQKSLPETKSELIDLLDKYFPRQCELKLMSED